MYKTIVNPGTGRKVKVNGKIGKKVLNSYKKQFQLGGNITDNLEDHNRTRGERPPLRSGEGKSNVPNSRLGHDPRPTGRIKAPRSRPTGPIKAQRSRPTGRIEVPRHPPLRHGKGMPKIIHDSRTTGRGSRKRDPPNITRLPNGARMQNPDYLLNS